MIDLYFILRDLAGASAGVDRLEFIVLVDNSIEWMTQLPPGWSTELKLQLQNGLPLDQETGVPILDLPNFCCGELAAA